jgi:hypothetical protein
MEMTVQGKWIKTWGISFVTGVLFAIVVALMCRHGAEIADSDTLSYLRFSQTSRLADLPIHHGIGYAVYLKFCSLFFKSFKPMTAFGNIVCGFLFAIILTQWFLEEFGEKGILGACAILANYAVLEVYARAMSEGLFLLSLVGATMGLSKWWTSRNRIWLLISGLVTGIACLTRYAGIPFACCFALCIWRGENVGKTGLRLGCLHLGLSLVGLFVVVLIHHLFSGTGTNRIFGIHWAGKFQLGLGASTMTSWFMPDRLWLTIPGLSFVVFAIILLFCILGFIRAWTLYRPTKMLWSLSSLAYILFLFLSYSLFDSDIHFERRILSPIIPFLYFGLADVLFGLRPKFRGIGWLVFTFLIVLGIFRASPMIVWRFHEGGGWGSVKWEQSATIHALGHLPKPVKIYSNAAGLFAWRGLPNVEGIVFFQRPATEMDNPGFAVTYGRMLDELKTGRACLVVFPACVWMKRTVPFDRIVADARLEKLAEYEDGTMWGQPGIWE